MKEEVSLLQVADEERSGKCKVGVAGECAMAGLLGGADATAQLALAGASAVSGKLEEPDHSSANWYFGRDEIEKQSPSTIGRNRHKEGDILSEVVLYIFTRPGHAAESVRSFESGVRVVECGERHSEHCCMDFRVVLGCVGCSEVWRCVGIYCHV